MALLSYQANPNCELTPPVRALRLKPPPAPGPFGGVNPPLRQAALGKSPLQPDNSAPANHGIPIQVNEDSADNDVCLNGFRGVRCEHGYRREQLKDRERGSGVGIFRGFANAY